MSRRHLLKVQISTNFVSYFKYLAENDNTCTTLTHNFCISETFLLYIIYKFDE